ncbi:hypothetical protein LWI29_021146 [Acer saccharum]|uniref:DUF4219 domain-containing protein n=1 Tax=Acer saccharum TaxID=4024 RepID=A0AA39RZY4_ACESA|nr:hypothetical protein LWI29_021146 [Acer saccharum]
MSSSSVQNPSSPYSLLPNFSGENYDFWKVKMKTLLLSEGLWNIVNNGFTEPAEESRLSGPEKAKLEADQMTDAKALSKIQNGVTATIFPRIMRATTAKQAWEILEREFQGDNKAKVIKLQTFRREFENLKMKESESVKEYFSRVIGVVNHMRTLGEDVTDQKVVEKILISLPEKYEHIVAAIEESKDLTTLSVEQLMGSLESHEQRRLLRNDQSMESAFQTKHNLKQQKSFKKSDQQRGDRRKWNRGESSKKEDNKNHRDYVADDSKPACKICKRRTMILQIVGIVESLSALIVKSLGMLKEIADTSRMPTKLKRRTMMKAPYFMLANLLLKKKTVPGTLTVAAAITCQVMRIFSLMLILQLHLKLNLEMVLLWNQKGKGEFLLKQKREQN